MNLSDCYLEEDLFPKIFTDYEERDYGILFYNEDRAIPGFMPHEPLHMA